MTTRLVATADKGKLTVDDYLKHWVEDVVRLSSKRHTYLFYEQYCRLYLVPHVGRIPLAKLTPQHLERMYAQLAQRLSSTTVHHLHVVIKTALNHAVETGLLLRNIAGSVHSVHLSRPVIL